MTLVKRKFMHMASETAKLWHNHVTAKVNKQRTAPTTRYLTRQWSTTIYHNSPSYNVREQEINTWHLQLSNNLPVAHSNRYPLSKQQATMWDNMTRNNNNTLQVVEQLTGHKKLVEQLTGTPEPKLIVETTINNNLSQQYMKRCEIIRQEITTIRSTLSNNSPVAKSPCQTTNRYTRT